MRLTPFLLCLAVLVAGCSTTPVGNAPDTPSATPGETPPAQTADSYFVFQNERADTFELTAYLGEQPMRKFRVTFSNGTTTVVDQPNIPAIATHIEPAGAVYSTETYVVGPHTTLFLQFRGCDSDTSVWWIYNQPNTTAYSYGQAHPCPGFTARDRLRPNEGAYSEGGDYRDVLDDPNTVVRTLSVNGTA